MTTAPGAAPPFLRTLAPHAGVPFKTSIIGIAPVTNAKLAKLEGEKE